MNSNRSLALFAAMTLSAVLGLGGCKSNNQQPADQSAQQPAASQPADTAASGQPSASGGQPSPGSRAAGGSSQRSAPRTPPPPAVVNLPEGTDIRVRLDQELGSQISHSGDAFSATVSDDVMVNGEVVIPKEARADGTVTDAKPLGRFKGGAMLSIKLDRVHTRWGTYAVQTSSISRAEKGKGKRTGAMIGGGAGLGALIGGLAGGGKGAVIGALAGGGAGTAGSAFTGNKQIVLPAETLLTFKLDHSVRITESAHGDPALQQPQQ